MSNCINMESTAGLMSLLDSSLNEIYIFNQQDLAFIWANKGALSNTQYTLDDIRELTPLSLKPQYNKGSFSRLIQSLHKEAEKINFETVHRRKDGSVYDVEVFLEMGRFKNKEVYIAIISDITRRVKQEKIINNYLLEKTYQANHDPITNLPNRRALSGDICRQLSREAVQSLSVVFVDLDNFKDINDTMGHYVGDLLLAEVAKRLLSLISSKDELIRFGSDEFLFLIREEEKNINIQMFCEGIMAVLNRPFSLEDSKRSITASIGVSKLSPTIQLPFSGKVLNELIRHADYALCRAKKSGKNNYYLFDEELDHQLQKRTYFLSKFSVSIDLDKFDLHFQPILNLKTKEIVGAEALLRWQPEGRFIPPIDFIPLLEETGRICEVGNWVLDKIYQFAVKNKQSIPKDFKFCFNTSVIQLSDQSFIDALEKYSNSFKAMGILLEMEITESVFASDMHEIHDVVNSIQVLGVNVSVDDFGTGYSCLEYLRILPINTLKIDKRFIDDCLDRRGFGILQSIITLAASLDLDVIAEGIETMDQLRCLGSLESIYPQSSVYGQGYLFHKPLLAEQLISKLSS
ncbi:MAG: EAL domain-containing protein [Coxiellaceae bacterium]|nr:EAL domain-containing protein [Coxiellaceae bacterium]